MDKDKIEKIKNELKLAGVASGTLLNLESKRLAKILHDGETIGGVVHGAYAGGLAWLVATDKRVLFMENKPFFSTMDELSYDVVSGAKSSSSHLSTAVTLHTRVHEYTLGYVREGTAKKFIDYIESQKMSGGTVAKEAAQNADQEEEHPEHILSNLELSFLTSHNIGVLSTIDRTGNLHGAVVNYLIDQNNYLYILTKSNTEKSRNVIHNHRVAFTIYDEETMQTIQIDGSASIERSKSIIDLVIDHSLNDRTYKGVHREPPVSKIMNGDYIVIKITPHYVKYSDFNS